MLEVMDGIFGEVGQVVLGLLDVHVDVGNLLFGFLDVEDGNLAHGLLTQFQHMLAGNLLAEKLAVRIKPSLDAGHLVIPRGEVFLFKYLVDALLEEYLFQRHPVPTVFQFCQLDFQFLPQQVAGAEGRVAQNLAGGHEDGFVVHDDTGLRREAYLATGEGVEGIDHLVGRNTGREVAHNLHFGSGVVVHLLDFDFPLLVGFQYTLNQHVGGDAVRYLGDDDGLAFLVVVHFGADAQAAAQGGIVVFGDIYQPSRGEVGIDDKRLVAQDADGGFQQLAEVVRKNHRGERDGDALGALRQQQRELDGQRHRLLLAAVIAGFPLGGLGVEHHLLGEFRQTGLDITASSRPIAREDVAPVTLTVNQQVLLHHVDQRIVDGGVAMGMVEHGGTHDIGHFGETAVIGLFHGVQDATLHRFEAVVDVGNRAVQDNIGGIINPIIAEHACQRQGRTFACRAFFRRREGGFLIKYLTVVHGSFLSQTVIFFGYQMLFVHNCDLECKNTHYFTINTLCPRIVINRVTHTNISGSSPYSILKRCSRSERDMSVGLVPGTPCGTATPRLSKWACQ